MYKLSFSFLGQYSKYLQAACYFPKVFLLVYHLKLSEGPRFPFRLNTQKQSTLSIFSPLYIHFLSIGLNTEWNEIYKWGL